MCVWNSVTSVAGTRAAGRFIFPYVEWTILVGTKGNDCSVSPTATCSNDEMSDYIRPTQRHSPGGQACPFCIRLGIEGKHLKGTNKKSHYYLFQTQ